MTEVKPGRLPEVSDIVDDARQALAAADHALGPLIHAALTSNAWSTFTALLVLFIVFAAVQGFAEDSYRQFWRLLRRVTVTRWSFLGAFLRSELQIIVTEYEFSVSDQLQRVIRVKEGISRPSYEALAKLISFLAERRQRDCKVIGTKQRWSMDNQSTIILGSQITNSAAQLLARKWNEVYVHQVDADSDASDGSVGISLREHDGAEVCTVAATYNDDGSGTDGAILIYSRHKATGAPVLQVSGCSSLGTLALVSFLTRSSSERTRLFRKTLGRRAFIAFFDCDIQDGEPKITRLRHVFPARAKKVKGASVQNGSIQPAAT